MSGTTAITVRALAYGGRYIGKPVGFAKVEIFGPHCSEPLAQGLTNQGLAPGTDGSGVTQLIMGQRYFWGTPFNSEQATAFTAEIPLEEPAVLEFVATSMADPRIKVQCSRLAAPGVALMGSRAVVLILHGLLTDLLAPATGIQVNEGSSLEITARVRLMCGSRIEDHFWPVTSFDVRALILHEGMQQRLTLNYTGTPSVFAAAYRFTSPGTYRICVQATEADGNLGRSKTVEVIVK
ncbi:MAG TPA: hypothetical protein VKB38_12360 [Terracidiphilus sp.]|nr:hypothetical protein [Terracidiphilus sp.]